MPIEMRIEGNRCCPSVVCDVCQEPINDIGGNVLWHHGAGEQVYFTHKRCYQTFRHTHEAVHGHTLWQPLDTFLRLLSAPLAEHDKGGA